MRFVAFSEVAERFCGKRVAIVGSGPGSLDNEPGFIDAHCVVVRVNNYKTGPAQGVRADVHYAFYGTSIRKSREDLQCDGVTLCMCKLPNSQPLDSAWHRERNKLVGIDYRYIYQARRDWWFADTFVPDDERFLAKFELLGRHQPTTGFAAILDVLECQPAEVYLTGFDFFQSWIHNVDETWKPGDPSDPICHRPDFEAAWIKQHAEKFSMDKRLKEVLKTL